MAAPFSQVRARMGIQSSLKYAGYSTWRAVTVRHCAHDASFGAFPNRPLSVALHLTVWTFLRCQETGAFGGELPFELGREIWGPGKRFGTMHISPGRIYWFGQSNKQRDSKNLVWLFNCCCFDVVPSEENNGTGMRSQTPGRGKCSSVLFGRSY